MACCADADAEAELSVYPYETPAATCLSLKSQLETDNDKYGVMD